MGSWLQWLDSRPTEWPLRPVEAGLEAVRRQLLAVLDDCHGFECDRLRWRVHMAERPQELWLLRDAAFQAVASQHGRALAAERLEGLVPAFRALLSSAFLTRV